MFPDGCTLPAGVVLNIPVLPVKTTQTGVQHFWKRHVRLGGIGLPSILGFLGRMLLHAHWMYGRTLFDSSFLYCWDNRVLLHAHGMYGRALPSLKMESQKGSGYTSTSGQLEAIADNSRSTALQSSGAAAVPRQLEPECWWQLFTSRRCKK